MNDSLFDTDIEATINDIMGLDSSTRKSEGSPKPCGEREDSTSENQGKTGGQGSRKNQKEQRPGSQREQIAAHYNGLASKRRYV